MAVLRVSGFLLCAFLLTWVFADLAFQLSFALTAINFAKVIAGYLAVNVVGFGCYLLILWLRQTSAVVAVRTLRSIVLITLGFAALALTIVGGPSLIILTLGFLIVLIATKWRQPD